MQQGKPPPLATKPTYKGAAPFYSIKGAKPKYKVQPKDVKQEPKASAKPKEVKQQANASSSSSKENALKEKASRKPRTDPKVRAAFQTPDPRRPDRAATTPAGTR